MSDKSEQNTPLNVVIYWHMHQPEYRDLSSGEYHLPWAYLHSIKDYVDMVAHLENHPQARVVVNFAPILLEQIDDYARQLEDHLRHDTPIRDPLLSALALPQIPSGNEIRLNIIKSCLRANKQRLIDRFDRYKKLTGLSQMILENPESISYCSDQLIADLLVWYHLAWTAETVRNTDNRIQYLMKKAQHFSAQDRRLLIDVIHEMISGVIGRYKKLAEQGRIELSMTPYAHPIVPLLLDIKSATQSMPDVTLPLATEYPGGLERSRWHMQKGKDVFKHYFGFEPQGCWPSEGSVSAETIELVEEMGFKWLASGETVLRQSLEKSAISPDNCLHGAYQYRDTKINCFFRDDGLSDLIGFKYSDWHADDAVADLVHHLETIAGQCMDKSRSVVSIILDGENAWEYYPNNGYHFISALYERLSTHSGFSLTTYSDFIEKESNYKPLPEIVAGSWVYGSFSTWIGERDKNRAWDILVEAKQVYDRVVNDGSLGSETLKSAEMQLATCESSDWFWWFGEYNSAESVAAFDAQYRLHISNLYRLLKVEPPDYLDQAFSFGSGDPVMGGAMLPGQNH